MNPEGGLLDDSALLDSLSPCAFSGFRSTSSGSKLETAARCAGLTGAPRIAAPTALKMSSAVRSSARLFFGGLIGTIRFPITLNRRSNVSKWRYFFSASQGAHLWHSC